MYVCINTYTVKLTEASMYDTIFCHGKLTYFHYIS